MDIVCCTDNNYVIPCGVLVTSICVNNPKEEITVHILTEGISPENQGIEKGRSQIWPANPVLYCR